MKQKNEEPIVPLAVYGEYNPYRYEEPVYEREIGGREVMVINRFRPPEWMLSERIYGGKLHPLLEKFFNALFPDKEQRQMVFSWIRNMIVRRNQNILTLNGPRATGKTILGERLLPPLVGQSNFRKSGEGFLKKEFNSIMSKNRLIYVDEFPLNNESMTKIKNYLNDVVSIEGKGRDEQMETNYCSIIYSSNNITDIAIRYDERRFSVIETRQESLLKAMKGEEIAEMVALMDSPEEVKKFANWVLEQGEHSEYSDPNFHYKGEHFYRLVRANLTVWQRNFLEGVRDEYANLAEFDYPYIKKKFFRGLRKCPENIAKLADFLKNFKDRNGEFVGGIRPSSTDGITKVFVPNAKFFRTWTEDQVKDFEYLSNNFTTDLEDKEEEDKLKSFFDTKSDDDIF